MDGTFDCHLLYRRGDGEIPQHVMPITYSYEQFDMGMSLVHSYAYEYCIGLNGKSLSWMGLTRERWCCIRDLMSRLDMNTCQTSIKTDILL